MPNIDLLVCDEVVFLVENIAGVLMFIGQIKKRVQSVDPAALSENY